MELIYHLPRDLQINVCKLYDGIYKKRLILYYKKRRAILRASKLYKIDKIISKGMDTYSISYLLGIVTVKIKNDYDLYVLQRTTDIISALQTMKQYWRHEDWVMMKTVSLKKYGNRYGLTNILDIWEYCSKNVNVND